MTRSALLAVLSDPGTRCLQCLKGRWRRQCQHQGRRQRPRQHEPAVREGRHETSRRRARQGRFRHRRREVDAGGTMHGFNLDARKEGCRTSTSRIHCAANRRMRCGAYYVDQFERKGVNAAVSGDEVDRQDQGWRARSPSTSARQRRGRRGTSRSSRRIRRPGVIPVSETGIPSYRNDRLLGERELRRQLFALC